MATRLLVNAGLMWLHLPHALPQVGRRGVTSMNWPKPKIKLDSKQGSVRWPVAAGVGWAKDEEGELGGVEG